MTRENSFFDFGVILNEDTIRLMCNSLQLNLEGKNNFDLGYMLYEYGICEYMSEFTGEAHTINKETGEVTPYGKEVFANDVVFYIPLIGQLSLIKSSFSTMKGVEKAIRDKVGKHLPEDFDVFANLRFIVGTYYG